MVFVSVHRKHPCLSRFPCSVTEQIQAYKSQAYMPLYVKMSLFVVHTFVGPFPSSNYHAMFLTGNNFPYLIPNHPPPHPKYEFDVGRIMLCMSHSPLSYSFPKHCFNSSSSVYSFSPSRFKILQGNDF